jgi:hypothetical protein
MLNPCYKALCIVESFVGCGNAIKLTSEYECQDYDFAFDGVF